MALFDLFSAKIPPEAVGATLVVADATTAAQAEPLLARLSERVGIVVLGIVGGGSYTGARTAVSLSGGGAHRRLGRIAPARLILLGRADDRYELAAPAAWPIYWINAEDARVGATAARATIARDALRAVLPHATLTGDPLLLLSAPGCAPDAGFCQRFREFRERQQWVIYFAATGEGEEPLAYASLFKLLQRQAGLMALAPADPARYEPVYRDAIAYRLPTNRHVRLITSAVPHKTRVYYIESEAALQAMYACADVVIVGGTLTPHSRVEPDLVGPLAAARATVMGSARRDDARVASALAAGVVTGADSVEGLVRTVDRLLRDAGEREAVGTQGRAWLLQHAGAADRVLDFLALDG